jgi:hypothetical protein
MDTKEYSYSDDYIVTDEYLLDYLLHVYKLDKEKLIYSIKKNREKEIKLEIIENFYNENRRIINLPFIEQWKFFKNFPYSGPYISKDDLEDYYHKYIQ